MTGHQPVLLEGLSISESKSSRGERCFLRADSNDGIVIIDSDGSSLAGAQSDRSSSTGSNADYRRRRTAAGGRRKRRRMSGSETGSEDQGGRGGRGGPASGGGGGDLASRALVLENKRFYLDVKENIRGRFIKIAEISPDGRKNQILMTLPTAALFRQHLVSMIEFYQELDVVDPDNLIQGELRSEVMFKDDKKYHVDLKVKFICLINLLRKHVLLQKSVAFHAGESCLR